MPSENLENLEELGLLLPLERSETEFIRLVEKGRRFHADSIKDNLSIESRFQLAYEASFSLALAALRWCGYRPSRNGRYVVFQALTHTISLGKEVAMLSEAHAIRNGMEYDADPFDDMAFLEELITINETLLDRVASLGS
ncbi:MAG: hypothetical protein JXA64_09710 [Candidatus Fermentibacteraceae bacterium]|nr:hypothetical protein [Candidatus Fermentibacteraceae bacterium]MBN2609374.1 hypothetical protein [Candidatus Fermentibacteraceae bacterium]